MASLLSHPYLLLVLAPVFWGGNNVAAKLAVGQIDPNLLLTGRWAGAALLMAVISVPAMRRDWPVIKASWLHLTLIGAVAFAFFNALIYWAAHWTTSVNISIEMTAIPMIVLVGNFIFFKVRARPIQIAGVILTMLGVAYVALHGDPFRLLSLDVNFGDTMILLAALIYAIYSLTLRYRPQMHWLSFLATTCFTAFVAALVMQLASQGLGGLAASMKDATLLGWACVAYVMSFPSVIAQLFYARGVELVGPNRASMFINVSPISGTLLSVLILGESLFAYHFIAAALIFLGIFLSEWSAKKP